MGKEVNDNRDIKVESKWGYRIFKFQILCVLITLILLFCKIFIDINWLIIIAPVFIAIGIPLILLIGCGIGIGIIYGIFFLFRGKDNRKRMIREFKKIKWKR